MCVSVCFFHLSFPVIRYLLLGFSSVFSFLHRSPGFLSFLHLTFLFLSFGLVRSAIDTILLAGKQRLARGNVPAALGHDIEITTILFHFDDGRMIEIGATELDSYSPSPPLAIRIS